MNIKLLKTIKDEFILDINSIHGLPHWERVEKIGSYLVKHTGADKEVVKLFAYLHDSKRANEDEDPNHGLRAVLFIRELHKNGLLGSSDEQLEQLCFACENHTDSSIKSNDITIQVCWDADRLDLGRVGIIPDKNFLNTDIAKQFNFNKEISI